MKKRAYFNVLVDTVRTHHSLPFGK
jgi:hypothetical protein